MLRQPCWVQASNSSPWNTVGVPVSVSSNENRRVLFRLVAVCGYSVGTAIDNLSVFGMHPTPSCFFC